MLPFLAVILLVTVVVGSRMQPREQQLQDGGGNGGGGGGRIIVKLGAVIVVRLFVIVVVPLVKMADVAKPRCLVFCRCCALVRDPDALLPPSHLSPNNVAAVKHVIIVLVLVFVI